MANTKSEKIASIQEQITHFENQKKKLIQDQKAQECKDRAKRLCRHMGLLESMLPNLITITDEQFETFVHKILLTEHIHHIPDG